MSSNSLPQFDGNRFAGGAFSGAMTIAAALAFGALRAAHANASAFEPHDLANLDEAIGKLMTHTASLERQLAEERANNRQLREVLRVYVAQGRRR